MTQLRAAAQRPGAAVGLVAFVILAVGAQSAFLENELPLKVAISTPTELTQAPGKQPVVLNNQQAIQVNDFLIRVQESCHMSSHAEGSFRSELWTGLIYIPCMSCCIMSGCIFTSRYSTRFRLWCLRQLRRQGPCLSHCSSLLPDPS